MTEDIDSLKKPDTKKWYVLVTKPKAEKKASIGLSKIDIENYLPLQKQLRNWHDRKKWIEVPLFTSYLFVNIEEKHRNSVFLVNGIVKYVSIGGEVSILRKEELERVKRLCSYIGEVEIETSNIKVGERVEIICGHFSGMQGDLISIKGKDKFRISIPGLGSFATVEMDKDFVKKLV